MRHPVRSDNEEGLAAEVRGILELENGCLYLSIDEIDERYPVLWPAQTAWDAERKVVELPTGDEIAVGELAYGGGGYFYVDDIARIAGPEAADLAGRCADNTYGEIAVVNNYDTAISPGWHASRTRRSTPHPLTTSVVRFVHQSRTFLSA